MAAAPAPNPRTEGTRMCADRAFDMLEIALEQGPNSGPFTFVNYGVARAEGAMGVHKLVAKTVTRRGQTMKAILNDLPRKDFSVIEHFGNAALSPYGAEVELSKQSFFERVVEPGSVSLGFSVNAMHWLSRPAPAIPNHIHASASLDPQVMRNFERIAQEDWKTLLARRSEELATGGHLILVNMARDHSGYYKGWNGKDTNLHDVMHQLWLRMFREGKFGLEVYNSANFQKYYKSEDEYKRVLKDRTSEAYRNGLRLVDIRTERVPCPHRARFDETGDVERFGRDFVKSVWGWSHRTFRGALEGHPEGEALLEEYYQGLTDVVMSKPHRFSLDHFENYLHIKKV